MNWECEFSEVARRDMRNIGPSAARAIKDFLEKRVTGCANPRAFGKPLGGDKRGLWRYRVQDYRVICDIQDARLVVLIIHAAHRSTAYDD